MLSAFDFPGFTDWRIYVDRGFRNVDWFAFAAMLHSNAYSHQNLPDMSPHPNSMNTSSDSDLVRNRENQEVEVNTGNNSDQNMQPPSGDDQQSNDRPKKRRYQRHSPEKIKEMEA